MLDDDQKVQYLVVDTSAFIRNAALQDIGVNIITEQDVVNEITNKRQLRRLVVLPYDLTIKNAFPEDVKFVTEFAKKTGDYTSLSATDIKVIALTYRLEKEYVGTDNIRTVPIVPQTIDSSVHRAENLLKPVAGFYMPQEKKNENKDVDSDNILKENSVENNAQINSDLEIKEAVTTTAYDSSQKSLSLHSDDSIIDSESDYETADSDTEYAETNDLSERFSKLECEPTEFIVKDTDETIHNVDDILAPVVDTKTESKYSNSECNESEEDGDEEYDSNEDEEDDEDDDSGWITPKNITAVKKDIDVETLEQKPVTVACLTMDFAMQNVLKQIGLNVVALDGRVIKQMRTFILRCHACFKTTSIMTKIFCPSCGNKTLKKVAVSLDEEGNQQIHINFRKPISKKGKRFSLPMPQGGKHANNPILCEDQPVPDQRPSRLARTKNDPLQDDYIAGYSPFIMRDVYSKSAMLGIRPDGGVKYWMKKNPNESRRRRK